jgi:hypothetical protein
MAVCYRPFMRSELAESAFAHREPISVAMYHEMIDTGVLPEKRRVELIEGVIVSVAAYTPAHVYAVQELLRHFHAKLGRERAPGRGLPSGR